MRVLIACEESGTVREAFRKLGHDAWSVDLQPTRIPGQHYQGSIWDMEHYLGPIESFDLVIAHPPCTALAVSGNRWYAGTKERGKAVRFVERIWKWPVERLAIENPVGVLSTQSDVLPKPYYIQPWQFGHGETKKTGLWTSGLPKLEPTSIVEGREQRVWKMGPSPDRAKERSLTYSGIAKAMAEQWGGRVA